MEKLKQTILPGLIAGGASLALYKFIYGGDFDSSISVMGKDVNIAVVLGGTVAVSDMVGNGLVQYVAPHMPEYGDLKKYEDYLLPPALTGLTTFGMFRTLVSENTNLTNAVILGSGSSVIGKYVTQML